MGMDISVLGVDLGKNVCSVVGLDASGAVVLAGFEVEMRAASVPQTPAFSRDRDAK